MKILVICQYYYPEQFRINDICEKLVEKGHTVTVLTGLPNYPTGTIPKEYRWGRKSSEIINGVKVERCFEIGRKSGIVGMGLNYASYMLSASLKAMFMGKDFDIIFVYQLSPVTMTLPGIIMKKRTEKPVYLYSCDIWPESMKNIIANERNWIYRIIKAFSTYLYSRCDSITVTSRPFIEYFHEIHSIPLRRLSYIPQHAEDFYLTMDFTPSNDVVDFVFMGNIGMAQDAECILEAVEMIKDIPNFKMHFVGEGSCLEKTKEIAKQRGLEEIVVFHGRHPLSQMPEFYKLADACILTLKAENLVGLTMPSKLQGYMAAGKPVIGAINGAAQEVIMESKCGVCVSAGDANGLAKAMQDFIENPAKYKFFGENGRAYFKKHFTKDIFIENIQRKLRGLMEV